MTALPHASEDNVHRTATCACGALKVTVSGPPLQVYACSCLECQRGSGSVFSYSAWFPDTAIRSLEGVYRTWRRGSDSGRWSETSFCPVCGSPVFGRVEAWPDVIGVSVGCFADPAFEAPGALYWSLRKHHWLPLPKATKAIGEQ